MGSKLIFWATLSIALASAKGPASTGGQRCRCIPSDACWPSQSAWNSLNQSIIGQLIKDQPVAISCYPGPEQNASECAYIDENWSDNYFQQIFPVGYSYPLNTPCPPVNVSAGEQPTQDCLLGDAPVYTVNATCAKDVAGGIAFARKHNLRLVIRDTGHDLLGRSTGFGSLQIWIKYLRTGITFHDSFEQAGSSWNGSAITVGGGYVWDDVYPEAAKRGLIVVGGGTPSVSCLGGWMQGGGHSPASHDYGLGADQVLQAKVLLADGSLVTASPTENLDLFFAIRGGGPGAYGVVLETTVKAYPTRSVVGQTLAFAPLTPDDLPQFMDALTDLYQSFTSLSEAGWSGFGSWSTASAAPIFANFTIGYAHTIANFRLNLAESQRSFASTLAKLNRTGVFVSVQYTVEPTYAKYYTTFSGVEPAAGGLAADGSRFLDTRALNANRTALTETLQTIAGGPREFTTNVVEFFGAPSGAIGAAAREEPVSGVNPAWRSMIVHQIVARGWTQDTPQSVVQGIVDDVRDVKVAALKRLAPDTGCYMNEADRGDPSWEADFYGTHYERLVRIKNTYDPDGVFYCPTCVGSAQWVVEEDGRLCQAGSA